MKKFIVSDLHGNGSIYDSIMGYLTNVNKEEDLTLYINGDLIDRGVYSSDMLIDVRNRIINNDGFKIEYLAGNHELMMHQAFLERKNNYWNFSSNWFLGNNGGAITAFGIEDTVSMEEEKDIYNFVSNLKIYNKFEETINDKQIVLVHAKCPSIVEDVCNLRVKDNDFYVMYYVWSRRNDLFGISSEKIGNSNYFTIIGHTPVDNEYGYLYYPDQNYLNIDGGCASYALGYDQYDHTPLVEIDSENNRLIILTFNNDNEIIFGNYFKNGKSTLMSVEELSYYRKYLSKNIKKRERILYND